MLISTSLAFVFMANRCTGEDLVVPLLRPYAEIERAGSPERRHITWAAARSEYAFVFDQPDWAPSRFFKFAVVRDPLTWVAAFRRGRVGADDADDPFQDHPHWSARDWLEDNWARLMRWDQSARLCGYDRRDGMDLVIPYEHLGEGLAACMRHLDLPVPAWRLISATEPALEADWLPLRDHVRTLFPESADLHQSSLKGWQSAGPSVVGHPPDVQALRQGPVDRVTVNEVTRTAGRVHLKGTLLLSEDSPSDYRLVLDPASQDAQVKAGLPSPWLSKRLPGQRRATHARFEIADWALADGTSARVRLEAQGRTWDLLNVSMPPR